MSNFTDDLAHVQDNTSWNEALADTIYAKLTDITNFLSNTVIYGLIDSNSTNLQNQINSMENISFTDVDNGTFYYASNPSGFITGRASRRSTGQASSLPPDEPTRRVGFSGTAVN